jgi:hypothetical protein
MKSPALVSGFLFLPRPRHPWLRLIFNDAIDAQSHFVDRILHGANSAHDLLRLLAKAGFGDIGFGHMEAVSRELLPS